MYTAARSIKQMLRVGKTADEPNARTPAQMFRSTLTNVLRRTLTCPRAPQIALNVRQKAFRVNTISLHRFLGTNHEEEEKKYYDQRDRIQFEQFEDKDKDTILDWIKQDKSLKPRLKYLSKRLAAGMAGSIAIGSYLYGTSPEWVSEHAEWLIATYGVAAVAGWITSGLQSADVPTSISSVLTSSIPYGIFAAGGGALFAALLPNIENGDSVFLTCLMAVASLGYGISHTFDASFPIRDTHLIWSPRAFKVVRVLFPVASILTLVSGSTLAVVPSVALGSMYAGGVYAFEVQKLLNIAGYQKTHDSRQWNDTTMILSGKLMTAFLVMCVLISMLVPQHKKRRFEERKKQREFEKQKLQLDTTSGP